MKLTDTRRLGATDAAPLLGVSKYGGPLDVYRRVVLGVEKPVTKQMERGTKYEPEVRRRYVEETGAELMQWVSRPVIVEHERYRWATSTPDDIAVGGVLAEYKTASRWAKGWSDGPPIDYVLQCQWGLWVTGLAMANLYVAFGEDGTKERAGEFFIERCQNFVLRRDDELCAIFAEVGGAFWRNHVETKQPPIEEPSHV